MKFQVSDGEKYQKIMEAEIAAEEMELAIHKASKRLAQKVNIPGFRKGKAPQSIIESFVGLDAILNEAAEELLPQAYTQGLDELGLNPVEQPQIEMVQLAPHQPMKFKATFTVKPEVKLGQYRGLPLVKYIREATEAEVEADIENQRQRLARTEAAEEGARAAEHDIVSIDFEGFREGIAFEGGKAEKYPLELGSHSFIPGFEEQLIGLAAGEEKEVNVTFPEEYQEKSLAGQPVVFKVKVHEIKRRVLPELGEEFAQEISETAENMEDLRNEVRERLNARHLEAAENDAKERAVQLAAEKAEMDVPPLMVEQRLDNMVQNMGERLRSQGLELAQFLSYTGQTFEQLREAYREQAERGVRGDLLLEAVVKAEDIAVSDEEVDKELELMAAHYWQPLEQIRELMSQGNHMDSLIEEIRMKKAADLIYEAAQISEEAAPEEEPEQAEEAEAAKPAKKSRARKPKAAKQEEAEEAAEAAENDTE